MANHKSALKRIRQNVVRNARNVHFKSFMRSRIRKVRDAIAGNKTETVSEALRGAVRAIDAVASKGVIHRNTASRKVARLSRAVHVFLTGKNTEAAS